MKRRIAIVAVADCGRSAYAYGHDSWTRQNSLPGEAVYQIEQTSDGYVWLRVSGIGISPENLTRIFGQGFTTKKQGHGFGLHSSVLAATAMGGTLQARSAGTNQGATFVLELPLTLARSAEV